MFKALFIFVLFVACVAVAVAADTAHHGTTRGTLVVTATILPSMEVQSVQETDTATIYTVWTNMPSVVLNGVSYPTPVVGKNIITVPKAATPAVPTGSGVITLMY